MDVAIPATLVRAVVNAVKPMVVVIPPVVAKSATPLVANATGRPNALVTQNAANQAAAETVARSSIAS